jgi:outer membrane protein
MQKMLIAIFCAGLFWAGCENPFDEKRFETISVPPEKLQQIDKFDLQAMSQTQTTPDANDLSLPEETAAQINLAIEECRALALENNLSLKVQLFSPQIAQENVEVAEADFEPLLLSNLSFIKTDSPTSLALDSSQQEYIFGDVGLQIPLRTGGSVSLDMPYSRTETDNIFVLPGFDVSYTSDTSISINQPLLRGGGIRTNTHAIRVARYDAQIVQARTKLEVIRVLAAVDIAYWRLYATRRELVVRKQEYDLALAQRERSQRMVQAGEIAEIEVIRAEEAVAQRLEAIILAENQVRDRERELKLILNHPEYPMEGPTILIPTTEPNPRHYSLDKISLLKYALDNRMELLELELQIAQDSSTIDFARNGTLPLLAVNYTYNINGLGDSASDSFDLMLRNRFVDHRLGLVLQVPLGNAAAKSRLRQALLQWHQRLAGREQREALIKQEVLNARDQLQANWQRVLASRKSTVLSARTLQAEQRHFELGLQTSTELLDAQTRFADAQSAENRALGEYQIAQVDLAFATGSLLSATRVHWQEQPQSDRENHFP